MSRPWMPLYVADYLADTGHLSAAEHGAYMLLIMHYWTNGGLPDDERRLARIARMSEDEWRAARDELASFFQDGWRHARIDAELAKSEEISSKRKAAAEQRHNKSNANASANAEQVQTQSQPQSQVSSNELTKTRGKRAQRGFSPEFEEFWSAYPRRPGNPKELASRKFETLRAAGVDPAAIIAGAKGYAGYCVGKEPQFIAQASTWLNNGRWKDDYSCPPRPPPTGNRRPTIADRYANLINDEPESDHEQPSYDGPTIDGSIAAIGHDAGGRYEASRASEPLGAEPGWPLAATGYTRAHN